ncbi:hypothetical protein O6H91_05G080200 [Diphasiastrum complanatum]|uniref:Uncharacterized protein n=1 Tax=Diphasiastrum complanatum TaxID=34168 RepID=A0ACC2DQ41_DIPCM|nr:hypothetical protein O6H91_05G080200 [Diphasiastrum complanatum]
MSGSLGKQGASPLAEEPASKRRHSVPDGSPHSFSDEKVVLNPADCNLDFTVGEDGLSGSALHHKGFGYCWSGVRATVGVRGGRYCFGCTVVAKQPVETPDTPPDQQHLCRVGVSRGDDDVECLGESGLSFGYGGTGKFSNAGRFLNYGETFGVGDMIICAIDLEAKPLARILFWKNGKPLGVAKEFDAGPRGLNVTGGDPDRRLPWHSALFPHVLLKNVTVKMQFDYADGLIPTDGFQPWVAALQDGLAVEGPMLNKRSDCEVLMMVGLPASGKTTWAEKRRRDFPEKRYVVLGTNLALELMKVPGLTKKRNYEQRFELLMERATEIFNKLLERAANTNRNYILDQTNVYKSARKRKLRPFEAFHKIAVVVFPTLEELRMRTVKRTQEMGKEVPVDAVNEMKANFILPVTKNAPYSEEFFDEVWFVELQKQEAEKLLPKMKSELPPSTPKSRGKFNNTQSPAVSVGSLGHLGNNASPYSGGSPGPKQMPAQVTPATYSLQSPQGRDQSFDQYDSNSRERYYQLDSTNSRLLSSVHGSPLSPGERFYSPRTADVRMPPSPYLNNISPVYSGFEDDRYSQRSGSYEPHFPSRDILGRYSHPQGRSPAPSPQYIPHISATNYDPSIQLPPLQHGWRPRPY